jgi:5-methylcytosine-specific restriction endonuclease McrA
MRYEEYIHSPGWYIRRQLLIIDHGGKCAICPRIHELQVHHLNYECLGHEKKDDVIVLCVRCHNDLHEALRKFSAPEIAVKQYLPVTMDEYEKLKAKGEL